MLEKLQAKRAALVAQREQQMANYNLTQGALAQIDELIGEEFAAAAALAANPAEDAPASEEPAE